MNKIFFSIVAVVFLAGCIQISQQTEMQINSTQTISVIAPSTAKCHIISNSLPDPNCTPGSIDTNVNQSNIETTVCALGYTSTIRPSQSYTYPIKIQSITDYGYFDTNTADYELDHLIPLELSGSEKNINNLWAEPCFGNFNCHMKDKVENYLNEQVCSNKMTLANAQESISKNWTKYCDIISC